MSNQRDHILRTAQSVLDKAEHNIREGIEPCENCRYSRQGMLDLFCTHPIVKVAQMNTLDSYYRERLAECDHQRRSKPLWGPIVCGPDGELFERNLTFWEWVFGKK